MQLQEQVVNTRLNTLTYTGMSQTSSVFWGSKLHILWCLSRGARSSLGGVGVERLSGKLQPDTRHRPPGVCAATVTAGGHGGKAPRILRYSVSPNPQVLERGATEHMRCAQGPAPLEQKVPRTEPSQPVQAALSPRCIYHQGCTPSLWWDFGELHSYAAPTRHFRVISITQAWFIALKFACCLLLLPAALTCIYTSSLCEEENGMLKAQHLALHKF